MPRSAYTGFRPRALVKGLLEAALSKAGYALKDASLPPQGLDRFVQCLRARGFQPATVIDAGVGNGTDWLYSAFPDAHFELFEPLDVFLPSLERICSSMDARYHLLALGAERASATIDVNLKTPTSSTMAGFSTARSIIKGAAEGGVPIRSQSIQVHQLDEFGPFEGPVLLKLDVEGFEMDVLRGASVTLSRTDVIISEISVTPRHARDPSLGEFLTFMETIGFSLMDIPELTSLGRDRPLAYIDGAFVRSDSPLRR